MSEGYSIVIKPRCPSCNGTGYTFNPFHLVLCGKCEGKGMIQGRVTAA